MTVRKIISKNSSSAEIHSLANGSANSKNEGSGQHGLISRSKSLSAIRPVPRRGLSREEAAMYVGISTGKFDELVRTGRMPRPKRIDGRKVWDVHGLDAAFDDLPSEGNSWDDA
jgi:predicted DNA-binding transcriptional regulator AlpA